jgi:hypothetical protein
MKPKYLVAAKNTDGRLCCWAQNEDLAAAKASVDRRWPTHGGSGCGCYEGEVRGRDEVHVINEDGSITPYVDEVGEPMPMPMPRSRSHENAEERAGRERAEEDRFDYLKDEGLLRRR